MSAAGERHPLSRLWVLMATVFVDMLGFFIVLPLLPYYAERLGADPLRVGALVSMFALAQLVTAPLWGRLSDRSGRRPVILVALLVSAAAYAIFELAESVWMLFLSRFVQGAGSGTIGVVQAYVSDSVGKEERAKALGWLTAATSAGVMVGPALGSLSAALGWVGPGFLAAGLCILNFLFAWRSLPEPARRARDRKREGPEPGTARRLIVDYLVHPGGPVARPIWIYTLGMMAFMAMNGVFALYLERVFGITEATIGYFFLYVGGVSLVMRAVVLGPVIERFGERPVMRAGAAAIAIGMAAVPLAGTILGLGLAVLLIPVGTAFLFPTTTSMVSQRAPQGLTGTVLGVQQSFGGVSRMVGPLWAGAVFQHLGIGWPFWIAALVMAGAFVVSLRVAEDPGRPEPETEPAVAAR